MPLQFIHTARQHLTALSALKRKICVFLMTPTTVVIELSATWLTAQRSVSEVWMSRWTHRNCRDLTECIDQGRQNRRLTASFMSMSLSLNYTTRTSRRSGSPSLMYPCAFQIYLNGTEGSEWRTRHRIRV